MKARDNNLVTTRRAQNNRMQLLSFLEQTFPFRLKMDKASTVLAPASVVSPNAPTSPLGKRNAKC